MAGPIHGSIEHLFLGTLQSTGSAQSAFVNVYNFLNNNTGTLGIRRIAYNTGSQNTGMAAQRGMNYYDTANPAGDNAWACFAFTSASNPFYVLIQWTGNANGFGSSPGSPGLYKASATTNVLGFAFAARADAGNPWNGSSGSNVGSDTKGSPVWTRGSSVMWVSPRSNDGIRAGSHGTNKENTAGFSITQATDYRMSMVADYDNFCVVFDGSNDNSYDTMMMCSYTPLSGVNPDVSLAVFNGTLPLTNATNFGSTAGNNSNEGSMAYPNLTISGSCMAGMDRYTSAGFFQNTNAQPNRAFATPTFDEFPLIVGIFETPNQIGATGQLFNFYREVYNVSSQDTNSDGTRAAFGLTTVAAVKMTIPWVSGTVPGGGVTRAGFQF